MAEASTTYGAYNKVAKGDKKREEELEAALKQPPKQTVDSILAEARGKGSISEDEYVGASRAINLASQMKEAESGYSDIEKMLSLVGEALSKGTARRTPTPVSPGEEAAPEMSIQGKIAGKNGINRGFEKIGGSIVLPGHDDMQIRGPALPGRSGYRNQGVVSFKDPNTGLTRPEVWNSFFKRSGAAGSPASPSTVASGTQLASRQPNFGAPEFTDIAPTDQAPSWAPGATRIVKGGYGSGFIAPASAIAKQASPGSTSVLPPVAAFARPAAEDPNDRTKRRLATLPTAPQSIFRR